MAITISGENNNDRILAADGVIDQISGINFSGIITASHINVGSNIQLGNAGIVTATTFIGDVTGNINSTSNLLLQISGSERFRVGNNGQWGIGGANYGTSGQVFTSGGSGGAPSWTTIPSQVNISNNADDRVITGGSGVNLNGEQRLTFNSSNILTATETGTGNGMGAIRSATANAGGNAGYGFMTNGANRFAITTIGSEGSESLRIYDDNNNSERFRIDSSGNVGIDETGTILGKLHVVGGRASGTAYNAAVFAGGQNSTSGSGVKLYLSGCENDPISRGVILESIMTDNSNAHRFSVKVGGSSAAPTERFQLASGGQAYFFGNQTNTPNGIFGFRYDKSNDTDLSIENLNNSSVNNNAGIRLASNHGNIKLRYFNNGGFYIQNSSDSGYLHYYEGNNSRFYIDTNGKIGINETSPQQQVHVHCDTNYQGILINGNVAPRIAFARSTTTTGEWSVGIDGTNGNNFAINNSNDNSNNKIVISSSQVSLYGNVSVPNGNIVMGNSRGIDFSATADGGTGTPSELLDDYEEGYFAPEITNLSSGYGSGTFYNRQARYTKVGNMVNCWVHIQFWGVASTSGSDNLELTITGFPFEVDGVGYSGSCGGGLQCQSWRYSGSGWNNYATTSNNVQPRINSLEQIRFGVCGHNGITGQVTQKSINGYAPNIEFFFSVRVTSYK